MRNRKLFMSAVIITTALLLVGCGNKVEPVDAEATGTVSEESTEESLESIEESVESIESSSAEESSDSLESEESSAVEDSSESLENSESEEVAEEESQETGIEIVEELDKNMYVQTSCNVRSGDSTDYEKVASLGQGTSVHVTGRTANNWYRVDLNNEVVYVSGSLLGDNAPVVQQQASGGNGGNGSGSSSGGASSGSGDGGSSDGGVPEVGAGGIPVTDMSDFDWGEPGDWDIQ